MQPFLQHHHQMVATMLVPPPRGNQSKPLQEGNDRNVNVFIYNHEVNIKNIYHSYDIPPSKLDQLKSQPSGSLTIEKPTIGIVPHPPKVIYVEHCIILMHELLITQMLLRKQLKNHVPFLPWRCCNIVLHKERNYYLQLDLFIHLM